MNIANWIFFSATIRPPSAILQPCGRDHCVRRLVTWVAAQKLTKSIELRKKNLGDYPTQFFGGDYDTVGQGSLNGTLFWIILGDQTMQIYGIFEGFPLY